MGCFWQWYKRKIYPKLSVVSFRSLLMKAIDKFTDSNNISSGIFLSYKCSGVFMKLNSLFCEYIKVEMIVLQINTLFKWKILQRISITIHFHIFESKFYFHKSPVMFLCFSTSLFLFTYSLRSSQASFLCLKMLLDCLSLCLVICSISRFV